MVRVDRRNAAKTEKRIRKRVAAEVKKAAKNTAKIAKELAPVDTGRLRDSIGVEEDGKDLRVVVNAPYAMAVELGAVHTDAQPFIRPALNEAKQELSKRLKKRG